MTTASKARPKKLCVAARMPSSMVCGPVREGRDYKEGALGRQRAARCDHDAERPGQLAGTCVPTTVRSRHGVTPRTGVDHDTRTSPHHTTSPGPWCRRFCRWRVRCSFGAAGLRAGIHRHQWLAQLGAALDAGPARHVVLVNFWARSCINCIHAMPAIKSWYATYRDRGFVVVGVHTPEFAVERSRPALEAAVARFGLAYPIAQDNESATWNAYGNQFGRRNTWSIARAGSSERMPAKAVTPKPRLKSARCSPRLDAAVVAGGSACYRADPHWSRNDREPPPARRRQLEDEWAPYVAGGDRRACESLRRFAARAGRARRVPAGDAPHCRDRSLSRHADPHRRAGLPPGSRRAAYRRHLGRDDRRLRRGIRNPWPFGASRASRREQCTRV